MRRALYMQIGGLLLVATLIFTLDRLLPLADALLECNRESCISESGARFVIHYFMRAAMCCYFRGTAQHRRRVFLRPVVGVLDRARG